MQIGKNLFRFFYILAITTSVLLSTVQAVERSTPSVWAEAEVAEAISLSLVPLELQNHYQENITRAEFAQVALNLVIEQFNYDKTYFTMSMEHTNSDGTLISPSYGVFNDTSDTDVVWAYALGIVEGQGEHIFKPNDPITRQEAAVMLTRAYSVYSGSVPSTESEELFIDENQIASWAKESVHFVNKWEVMNGLGNRVFAPEDYYTREQCYLTVLRLYKNAPISRQKGNVPKLVSYEDEIQNILYPPQVYGAGLVVDYRVDTDSYTVLYGAIGGIPHEQPKRLYIISRTGGFRIPKKADGTIPTGEYHNFQLSPDLNYLLFSADDISYQCELATSRLEVIDT